MNVLAFNPGSSSLRYKLVAITAPGAEVSLHEGRIERVHGRKAVEAAQQAVDQCKSFGIDALGFRVAHGGPRYRAPAMVTPELLAELNELTPLAPLHIPTAIAVIEAVVSRAPRVHSVAVFDTAFHATMPAVARRYAIPSNLGNLAYRFGSHGIAHQWATEELFRVLGRRIAGSRVISVHLGDGASICAVRDGLSVDTSMGATPLEGLVMNTRCGDIDPGVILALIRQGRTVAEVEDLLTRRSGLLGISDFSGELGDLEPAAEAGDERAELALESYAYRIRKYIGAYSAVLGGADALVLSGSVAETSASFRRRLLQGLESLGVVLDDDLNRRAGPKTASRLTSEGPLSVWLVAADEERAIARETSALLCGGDRFLDRLAS